MHQTICVETGNNYSLFKI